MMSCAELLAETKSRGIRITVDSGNLSINAPKGSMTEELKDLLRQHKEELVAILSSTAQAELVNLPPIDIQDRDQNHLLSYAQQRLWFLDQMEPGEPVYNIPLGYFIEGELKVDALHEAVRKVVDRHEALRTRFIVKSGQALQEVLPAIDVPLPITDFSDSNGKQKLLDDELNRWSRHRFSLEDGPLFMVRLYRLSTSKFYFFVNVHHSVFDGSSVGVFLRELLEFYDAAVEGRAADIQALPIQYLDYSVWQRDLIEKNKFKSQLTYWRENLTPLPSPIELPTNRIRPEVQTFSGAVYNSTVDKSLTNSLSGLANEEGASLFMVLLSALNILLYKYSRCDDQAIGTPVANRPIDELENLIGYFANTLVLRTKLQGELTVRQLLRLNKEVCFNAFSNQDIPFERIVEELSPPRDASRTPLFQILLSYQDATAQKLHSTNMELIPQSLSAGGARTDLTIEVINSTSNLHIAWEYNTSLFDHSSIEEMSRHFNQILTSISGCPDNKVVDVEILTKEQKLALLQLNPKPSMYAREELLVKRIELQARDCNNRIAVVSGEQSYTYNELNQRANKVAHYLLQVGVKPKDLVGISLDRTVNLLVGVLGILKTGAAYVPLDPDYPVERLQYMMESAGVDVLLTENEFADVVKDYSCHRVCLDGDWAKIDDCSASDPGIAVKPDDLAYVIFTSGSTGKPKGVQVPHGAVLNFLQSMAKQPGMESNDKLLAVTTLSFDIAVLELYLPLFVGATTVIAGRNAVLDGRELAVLLERHDITIMQATPSTWRMLLSANWPGGDNFKVLCGGEAFPTDLAQELCTRTKEVWNMYGPTETTVWSTCWRVTSSSPILIGRPIDNTQCYVLDEYFHLLPMGVPGELYIGGEGVTSGYLNRPDLTKERFVKNPFSEGSRLYRTGDSVKILSTGEMQHLGRLDDQIKLRGFRIELGEIEAALVQLKEVTAVAVYPWVVTKDDIRLVACCVPHAGENLQTIKIRKQLREVLPAYMIPQYFLAIEAIPLLPNGKVNRRNLPKPEVKQSNILTKSVLSSNAERLIAGIWADLVKPKNPIGREDNFFEIGGHSMLALEAIGRIENKTGKRLTPRDILVERLVGLADKIS